jgi:hypothetical protein
LVKTEEDGRRFVRCAVRECTVSLTPEEQVRQALVWFLKTGGHRAAVLSERLRIGVEERSLDVAGFASGSGIDARFAPSITVVVFETKREETEIRDGVDQLAGYMRRERCRAGMLFNARQAAWATLDADSPNRRLEIEHLADLREAEERIHDAAVAASEFVRTCRGHFIAARDGNFDSLARLVVRFGSDASLTFSISIRAKGSLSLVGAFNLSVISADEIGYWIKGMATKRKRVLTRTEFHSLRSLLP